MLQIKLFNQKHAISLRVTLIIALLVVLTGRTSLSPECRTSKTSAGF